MNTPRYPYRLVVFGDGSQVRILRYITVPERDKAARQLAADGSQVLVCTVNGVFNGGDEGRPRSKPVTK